MQNEPKESPDELTNNYIEAFGGDLEAAIAAIRNRIERDGKTTNVARAKPERPVGKTLISVESLAKKYKVGKHDVHALNGVSLTVHAGEFLALTGASGSGKSTLLQLMGGLDKPTAGQVVVDGQNLASMSDGQLSRFRGQTIGFVFQFFYLQPFLRLDRNLEVPGMFARVKRAERQARVRELAEKVGIADQLNHLPRELSGGQIQRAAVVRALMNNPKIILADEPTGNLDSENSGAIISLFEYIRETFGTTVIIATHDTGIAGRADRIVLLKDGALV